MRMWMRCQAFHEDGSFLTCETLLPGDPSEDKELIFMYDLRRSVTAQGLQPISQFTGHNDMITCLAVSPKAPNLFISGSKDLTVRLWDRRSPPSAVVMLGSQESGKENPQAHSKLVTSLDMDPNDPNTIYSSGADLRVCQWDLRKGTTAASTKLFDKHPWKVAASSEKDNVAVCTSNALLYVNMATQTAIPATIPGRAAGKLDAVGRYHTIKWDHSSKQLYAGSSAHHVDRYNLLG
ncbi:hypothetical protein CYMTET_23123 [Cymbomonas tetramitiformis]|uniref:Guanine nucleotide-binding protein subunit beta-like protein n=1 Tax=Cymbomonas tetramitiformis TaxID=36881 RepID=A0AAE0L1F2_9CHLO|nr:hypothetical protein CYMTET_23123 [Cymbomonas tetramitiformis]